MNRDTRLYLAWLVALAATLGSLYFSEIRHFNPCPLCWAQRIFMYPLAVILGIAAFVGDHGVRRYVLPLAALGLGFAIFQNLETWGFVQSIKACTVNAAAACNTPWPVWGTSQDTLNRALTIPVLSMIAFALILALLSWPRQRVTVPESAAVQG
ncbi:disulfide bond formation protein B [Deinococcus radiodurans]|jgi:Disulfide bond formation protein DsbB|uniref:Probable disulfide formation protein n=1 Tax=Deinococcus radiodurans (strain ATCC 13939 / DSM 20539 / JCM 16871 / CCUG 27074 / LMG 4051 / NBRC 15346 / NCIMB 9279 / VKM B-1422 / R1) TaxID=243230 RepID=BDBC_DEIRA|nr:disulfide bond formation protein B [Deinococcus radiodurans]Q9RWB5.1 RecName: Full=Probable disulfide formation protein; AltName: Full=Disulfide oxidoreductase; AltName: Full=Thiol-disulfide oxidoreductase [Deinococcus radiodurans R1 = ATCC 13939 = DSM 20539]AAF10333.1 conserved hypothetical protein [Deinococcus radiodurans R1 = ATCC 13939 = DSM 20539]ANC72028.1 disulfide bond formation protein [Deinococcus radiodurans R1 = ATCC 13939 = DSM 20539]QEM72692.1 disulfide bond formation protein B